MRILILCPWLPDSGGAANYLWQLARTGSEYSNWEVHLLAPEKKNKKIDGIDYFHKMPYKNYLNKPSNMMAKAFNLNDQYDYDLVLGTAEMSGAWYKQFKKAVLCIHSQIDFFRGYKGKVPVTKQSLHGNSKCFALSEHGITVQLISPMEELVWNAISHSNNYIVYPNMLYDTTYYGLPWEERSDEVLISGRINSYMKGYNHFKRLLEHTKHRFCITAPKTSKGYVTKFFKDYPNVTLKFFDDHTDVLKEMGKHKVFFNPANYAPFDLGMAEAANQGCNIVSGSCVGALDYMEYIFVSNSYDSECFECLIDKALDIGTNVTENNVRPMKDYIQHYFDTLWSA